MPNPFDCDDRYSPWAHARGMDIRIAYRFLPRGEVGWWNLATRTVFLDSRLSQIVRRCTLAHELVHAERGDDGRCASAWHENKLEVQVHAEAARRLIGLEHLALALLLHEHEHDQAEELWVDIDTLRARLAGLSAIERAAMEGRMSVARRRVA